MLVSAREEQPSGRRVLVSAGKSRQEVVAAGREENASGPQPG